jgi:hypothetical protein
MKQWYGMSRARYRGLARNACNLRFTVTAMNMKWALTSGSKTEGAIPGDPSRRSARRSNKTRRPKVASALIFNHPFSPQKRPKPLKPQWGEDLVNLRFGKSQG